MPPDMGYSHYYHRAPGLDAARFTALVVDARAIARALAERGIRLAGADGTGEATFDGDEIAFNGPLECGHAGVVIAGTPWPSPDAHGLAGASPLAVVEEVAFTLLPARVCNGDCSCEPFSLPRVLRARPTQLLDEDGLVFDSCKTAFRPYDLAVTAVLIAAKHHLGEQIAIRSDGEAAQWTDAQALCDRLFGYGKRYGLRQDRTLAAV